LVDLLVDVGSGKRLHGFGLTNVVLGSQLRLWI
jgi:hypothetical protein